VKINGCYYREVLLNQQLLTAIRQVSGDFFKCYNKTVHRRTGHARQSSCCNGRRPHSSHLIYGLQMRSDARSGLPETRSSAIAVIADRTACSILTLFIVSTTSRPLNKKSVCCQSANPINNYCGSASANSQSAHLSALVVAQRHRPRRSHRTALCRLAALETL